MKKIALVTAMALAATASTHAEVDVYGKAALGLDIVDADLANGDSESALQLNSNASRIGLKGSETIAEGLEAFYKIEYEVFLDEGDDDDDATFSPRNIYAGLEHSTLGSILFGRNDTPVKDIGSSVDLFNDLNAGNLDTKRTFAGEERADNLILYSLPKSVPANIKVGVNLDTATESEARDDKEAGIHAQLGYEISGVSIDAAYAGNFPADYNAPRLSNLRSDVVRLVAQYDLAGTKLGALYQIASPDDDTVVDNENAFAVSAKYAIPDTKAGIGAQFQMSMTDFNNGSDDADIMQYGLIGDYKFTKSFKGMAYIANRNTDLGNGTEDRDRLVVGTAMDYKF